MYLVPPKVMEKLEKERVMNTEFDNNMYKIAKIRYLDPVRKWQLYRQQLLKFMNKKRSASTTMSGPKAKTFDRSVQTISRGTVGAVGATKTVTAEMQTDPIMVEDILEHSGSSKTSSKSDKTKHITADDDDEVFDASTLFSPTKRLEQPYDASVIMDRTSEQVLADEKAEAKKLEDLNFIKKTRAAADIARKNLNVSMSLDDSTDLTYEVPKLSAKGTARKLVEQMVSRQQKRVPLVRKESTTQRSRSKSTSTKQRSQSVSQTGKGKVKKKFKWICI